MPTPFCVAILADIHGNLAALQAVLADVHAQAPDALLWGGDLVMNGPRPAETLALVRELGGWGVVGPTLMCLMGMTLWQRGHGHKLMRLIWIICARCH